MTTMPAPESILINNRYLGHYRWFQGRSEELVDDSSPPYIVPFTVSILASQSIFLDQFYSPAATLIIPVLRINVPYGYLLLIMIQFITALLVKWAYAPLSFSLPGSCALPDYQALKQIYSSFPQQKNGMNARTLRLNNSSQTTEESTPIFPEGIAINLSFLSPFSAPASRASTIYALKLTLIKDTPGYIIPVITLIIYFLLKPFLNNSNNKNNKR